MKLMDCLYDKENENKEYILYSKNARIIMIGKQKFLRTHLGYYLLDKKVLKFSDTYIEIDITI